MQRFYTLDKSKLTNGQHFAFMTAFVQDIQKIEDTPAKMKTMIDAMAAAQADEDKYLKMAQGSLLTEKIREADELRDNSYKKLRDIVKVWTGSGMEPQATAAETLNKVISTYRLNTAAQMDEESGLMTNLLTDISTSEMQANVTAIGAANLVANMRQGNEQVVALLKQRDEEKSGKVVGALRQTRLNSDKAYANVVEAVEAFNYTVGGYDEVITKWNATIDRYQDMLNRKTGSTKVNIPSAGDGTGGTGSGTTGNTNGSSGNSGNGNSGSGTTTPNPPAGGGSSDIDLFE